MLPDYVINVFDQVSAEAFQASPAFRVRVALLKKLTAFSELLPMFHSRDAKELEALAMAPTIRIGMALSDEDVEQLAQRLADCFVIIYNAYSKAGFKYLAQASLSDFKQFECTF